MKKRSIGNKSVSLTNKGQLSLFTLGCGSAFSRDLGQNNFIIIKGNDHLMVDCGSRTPVRLTALGLKISDIHNILPTHSHADHIGGLEEVMLTNRYVARQKPNVYIETRYQRLLWNESLKGGAAVNERHNGKYLRFEDFCHPVRPTPRPDLPRDAAEFEVGSLNIKIFRTNHFPEQANSWKTAAYSVGMVIDDRILFTGDTKYDSTLVSDIEAHFDIEWIFQDAQFFTGGIHASIDELTQLPESVRSRMLLMHYGDSWTDKVDYVKSLGFHDFAREYSYYDFD